MKIAVCIKEVPDTEARLRVRGDGKWLDEDDLRYVRNESDSYAVEEALAIVEKSGGEVVLFCLGPARVAETIRKTLAMGPHRAVHLVDDAFQGGDAHATARALAAAIRREEVDLVITGSQSDDVGYGSTGTMIAGHLGWPHAWLVMGLEVEEGERSAKVTREMESGMNEIFRLALPAVIEVQAGLNHPRYASLKGIMQAKRKPLDTPTPADLGLAVEEVGRAGSRLEILQVLFPESSGGAQVFEGDPAKMVKDLVEKLQKEARVL